VREHLVPERLDAAVLELHDFSVRRVAFLVERLDFTERLRGLGAEVELLRDFLAEVHAVRDPHQQFIAQGVSDEPEEPAGGLVRPVELHQFPVGDRPPEVVDEHHPLILLHDKAPCPAALQGGRVVSVAVQP
jgi:hypothetical protein